MIGTAELAEALARVVVGLLAGLVDGLARIEAVQERTIELLESINRSI